MFKSVTIIIYTAHHPYLFFINLVKNNFAKYILQATNHMMSCNNTFNFDFIYNCADKLKSVFTNI